MKCEMCKSNDAVVHFKQIINGEAKEMHLCAECASEQGLDAEAPMSVTDFLFGMGAPKEKHAPQEAKRCPACGMRPKDFKKRSRLGCPVCYETFVDELEPLLMAMQKGSRHVGKVPARERVSVEIRSFEKALEKAVERQDFEEAAQLRDRLHELKRSRPAGVSEPKEPSGDHG